MGYACSGMCLDKKCNSSGFDYEKITIHLSSGDTHHCYAVSKCNICGAIWARLISRENIDHFRKRGSKTAHIDFSPEVLEHINCRPIDGDNALDLIQLIEELPVMDTEPEYKEELAEFQTVVPMPGFVVEQPTDDSNVIADEQKDSAPGFFSSLIRLANRLRPW